MTIIPKVVSRLSARYLKVTYADEKLETDFIKKYDELLKSINYIVIDLNSIDVFDVKIVESSSGGNASGIKFNFISLKLVYLSGEVIEFKSKFSQFDVDLYDRSSYPSNIWRVQLLNGEYATFSRKDANLGKSWVATYSKDWGSDERRLVECKQIYDIIDIIADYRKIKC